ncbi:MAG TPA: hypothetical protein VNC40_10400 [Gaiellaceae bacterium]|nr:hypothetical protein [Gaiellaceae bacterium]
MRKLMIATVALLAIALPASAMTASAAKKKPVVKKPIAFLATYKGTATTQSSGNVVTIVANGAGAGTAAVLGAGKITGNGTGDSSKQPCVPFTGTGVMSGAKGTLTFKVNPGSSGCGDQAGQLFSVSGKATIVKGTGKLAKAKGLLRMTGTFDRTSGAFTVKFTGTVPA